MVKRQRTDYPDTDVKHSGFESLNLPVAMETFGGMEQGVGNEPATTIDDNTDNNVNMDDIECECKPATELPAATNKQSNIGSASGVYHEYKNPCMRYGYYSPYFHAGHAYGGL